MSRKRYRHNRPNTGQTDAERTSTGEKGGAKPVDVDAVALRRLRLFLMAFVLVILAARPLFPSEGAELGDGVAVVMLLLGGTLVGSTFLLGRSRLTIRLGWTDMAVLIVMLLAVIASIRGAMAGTIRPGINMAWEWLGYGLIWVLIRQLRFTAKEKRIILAGLASIAVGLAAYGVYQYLVEFPMMREEYQLHRDEWLRSLGWDDLQSNPAWLAQLENRVFSREPLATFALANSLAGFLLPWFTLTLAVCLTSANPWFWSAQGKDTEDQRSQKSVDHDWSRRQSLWIAGRLSPIFQTAWLAGLFAAIALTAICLVLTKSRSAYVAILITLVIFFAASYAFWQRRWRVMICTVVGLLVLATGLAIFLRGLDWAVLSEAGKSLTYRWQYWVATTKVICDEPLLGCGPGNFRYAYLRYKLPEASEEVSDPHSFVLELAATAGLPAATVLCLALLGTLFRLARLIPRHRSCYNLTPSSVVDASVKNGKTGTNSNDPCTVRDPEILALGGGLLLAWPAGWLLGLLSSAPQIGTFILVGFPAAVLAFIAFWPWIKNGRWSPIMVLTSLLALGIHWLAAGGLTFPGVAYSFWLLWAFSEDVVEEALLAARASEKTPLVDPVDGEAVPFQNKGMKEISLSGVWAYVACAGLAGTGVLCYFTAYVPVLDARGLLAEAARIKGMSQDRAEDVLHQAAKADPWAYEPWLRLLELWIEDVRSRNNRETPRVSAQRAEIDAAAKTASVSDPQELDELAENLLKRARNHHAVRWNLAVAYQVLAQATGSTKALQQAIEFAHQAIVLYPNQATYHVGCAEMLLAAGRLREAQEAARKALWLHEVTPHQDRKLPEETATFLRTILERQPSPKAARRP